MGSMNLLIKSRKSFLEKTSLEMPKFSCKSNLVKPRGWQRRNDSDVE